jgi:DNA-binding transcriptional LysR family regulator
MAEQHPQSRTIVISSMQGVESHFDALANGLVNILVTYGDPAIVSNIPHVETLEDVLLGNDELIPVVSGRFAKKARLRELGRAKEPVPFLAYSEFSFSEKLIAPLVAELGSRLRVVGESGLSETLKAMALNHMGVAWIPRFSIEMELDRGELVLAGGSDLRAPLMIKAYRSRTSRSEAADQLWNLLVARSRARTAL